MGKELLTTVVVGTEQAEATVRLESDAVLVSNSPLRRKVLLSPTLRTEAARHGPWLVLGELRVRVGKDVEAWLSAIQAPKSVAQKLGLGPGMRVQVRGAIPDDVKALVEGSGAAIVRSAKPGDWLLAAVSSPKDVAALPLPPEGGVLWILRPKGPDSPVPEALTREAARAKGLKDVKVVGVSVTHSAEKYVWPKR